MCAEDADVEIRMVYRPYQPDPTASPGKLRARCARRRTRRSSADQNARADHRPRLGIAAGEALEFRMDRALGQHRSPIASSGSPMSTGQLHAEGAARSVLPLRRPSTAIPMLARLRRRGGPRR
ncbi:MAG: hypothetical protein R2713_18595 [Ilumatobacteraceae bacterium]